MAKKLALLDVSRRERQILDVVYRLGRATVTQVRQGMTDPPSRTAVRTMVGILEQKGYLRHERNGLSYVYRPTVTGDRVRRSMLRHVVDTFFNGSVVAATLALLEDHQGVSVEDGRRLKAAVERARKARP